VKVRAGKAEAWALWDPASAIALRVFSVEAKPDAEWVRERVREALALRRSLVVSEQTNAYRLLYGEGDGLPGVVVDVYAGYAVIVTYSDALDGVVPWVRDALIESIQPKGILWRRSSRESGAELEVIAGHRPPSELTIQECGLGYYADLETGQKTGLFLDQRDNRQTLARFVRTGSLLNLFCYTGGFSVVAASRGARRVTSVDIAEPAIARAKDNFRLNGLEPANHEFLSQDCYEYLAGIVEERQSFDVVVCDPPSLARNRAQLEGAITAYTLLNARGIACVKPGGFYAAASCTSQVSPEAFRSMLGEAGRRANRRLQIVHETGHAADHPHFAVHPEGRYLKFVVARVLERA
jgi:23S rRNA (cytosine1962-C5)-methyltransferase